MFPARIAIIGGGPAGALAAQELARAGRHVLLFDENLAWEKPCGGGLTDKALLRWGFLHQAAGECNWISNCELISPGGRRANFRLDRQIAIFSRLTLNGLLLDHARRAGAQLIRERIVQIDGCPGEWSLKSTQSTYRAEFLLLAAGARTAFRGQFSAPLGQEDFMIAVGYYIPGTRHTVQVKFVKGLHGYIWIFPRTDHFSAGICGRMQGKSTAELREVLDSCLPEFGLTLENARLYAHIIPSLRVTTLENTTYSGDGWAMVGDAAGFVDPVTGEGLFYALRSAELLSQALLSNTPESYPLLVRGDFLPELVHAARIADHFYSGDWMGKSVLERMVQLTAQSPRFRDLMRDLFAGSQDYSNLKRRVYHSLPRIAAEALVSTLWTAEKSADRFPDAHEAT